MNKKTSVIIVTYNSKKYVKNCLISVLENKPLEIIVVDNNSDDGTFQFIKENFPQVKLICNSKNLGYAVGNNIGVKKAKGEYIVILNPDTKVEKNWLNNLLQSFKNRKKIVVVPKILNYKGNEINTIGNVDHFTGLTFVNGLGKNPKEFNERMNLSGISGACFAIRRKDFLNLGGFDEKFFIYMDDVEFSWRLHTKGFSITFEPSSIVYHDYSLKLSPKKFYHLEKGRYMILRKYFSLPLFFIFLPSLIFTEILSFGLAILNGKEYLTSKVKAIRDGIKIKVKKVKYERKKLLKKLEYKIP
ncbi:MAG: glycosyltransferase family 2 protein, partial [Candidatus Aenigmatarchaeota archaeon]